MGTEPSPLLLDDDATHAYKRARLGSLTNKMSSFNIEGQLLQQPQQIQVPFQLQQQMQQVHHTHNNNMYVLHALQHTSPYLQNLFLNKQEG